MSTGPQIATTPLEVLNGPQREKPFMSKIWAPTTGALLGAAAVLFGNWGMKRPLLAGLQNYAMLTVGTAGLFKVVDDYRNQYLAERDAVIRHYVELHPEDFPPFKRQKYSEVLESWVPIR